MDAFASSTSPHTPLSPTDPSQIRLLRLYAGASDDPIRCELHHVSLTSTNPPPQPGQHGRPLFTALSYTWGDPSVTAPILLDGSPFEVTTNLRAFLRHTQTVLLAIATYVPPATRAPQPDLFMALRFFVLRNILLRMDLPRDFPRTRNSELGALVRRYVEAWLVRRGWPRGPRAQAQVMARLRVESETWAPRECYMDFWIDALCINQRDLRERSAQVARMKDIYASASFLLIWLGDTIVVPTAQEGAQDIDAAIDMIHEMYRASKLEGAPVGGPATLETALAKRDAMRQLGRLLRQPWFSRLWIIQEVVVATSASPVLLFRHTPIPLDFLTRTVVPRCVQVHNLLPGPQLEWSDASRNLMLLHKLTVTRRDALAHMQSAETAANSTATISRTLLELLRWARARFQATDPRDYLYALLGLLGTDDIPLDLRPDYTLPFEHVFHKFTIYLIKGAGTINFLDCAGMHRLAGVPSWVPDWRHCVMGRLTNGHQGAAVNDWWDSLGLSSSAIKVSQYGLRLRVEGVRLGEVALIVFPPLTGIVHQAPDDDFGQLLLAVVHEARHVRSFVRDNWQVIRPNDPPDGFQRHWEAFMPKPSSKYMQTLLDMIDGKRDAELLALAAAESEAQQRAVPLELLRAFRKSFETWFELGIAIFDQGQVATVFRIGEAIRAGDIMCALKGLQAPCVLRPRGTEYSFVGVCGDALQPGDLAAYGEAFSPDRVERFVLI
ncbi:heterokaryon incompatibility protein-domain-containing protein [Cercophora scortea]|uniref:Heterokaryon incompatibility protein-domain-containing protein n=1 Tax=Cercophora scortea TaxID=314031 RepID=A0AAE0MI76_9PEZI|nr:heterokaryon incompatibility protein-domain-containing protein [Cercophora scortea]